MKTLANDPTPPTIPLPPPFLPQPPDRPFPITLPSCTMSRSHALVIKGVKEANDREYNGLQSLT